MGRSTLLMSVVAIAATVSVAAAKGPNCTQRDEYLRFLAKAHTERPIVVGLADSGGVLEILLSNSNLTWTILVTDAKGVSCMIAAGDHWQPLPDAMTREPSN